VVIRFVLWSLADSHVTIADLRDYVREEAAAAYSDVPGLLLKAWIADEHTERWGAIYIFANADAAAESLPSRARELIGKEPDIVEIFDLEATVSVADQLDRLGLVFE
jgi:hypothetical protein